METEEDLSRITNVDIFTKKIKLAIDNSINYLKKIDILL